MSDSVEFPIPLEKVLTIHIYHHFPTPLSIRLTDVAPPVPSATHATLTLSKGAAMPITVDTTGLTATVGFEDDHGDVTAEPVGDGSGIVVSFSTSDTTVATIAPDAANPLQGDITLVAEGTVTFSGTVANTSGAPLVDADGTTPFVQPAASAAYTVGAGQTTEGTLALSQPPS